MKSWLALALLLGTCSGCALLDDEPEPSYMAQPPWGMHGHGAPPSSCYAPPRHTSALQTQEPELLRPQ